MGFKRTGCFFFSNTVCRKEERFCGRDFGGGGRDGEGASFLGDGVVRHVICLRDAETQEFCRFDPFGPRRDDSWVWTFGWDI